MRVWLGIERQEELMLLLFFEWPHWCNT